jgi:hypothetical protein
MGGFVRFHPETVTSKSGRNGWNVWIGFIWLRTGAAVVFLVPAGKKATWK